MKVGDRCACNDGSTKQNGTTGHCSAGRVRWRSRHTQVRAGDLGERVAGLLQAAAPLAVLIVLQGDLGRQFDAVGTPVCQQSGHAIAGGVDPPGRPGGAMWCWRAATAAACATGAGGRRSERSHRVLPPLARNAVARTPRWRRSSPPSRRGTRCWRPCARRGAGSPRPSLRGRDRPQRRDRRDHRAQQRGHRDDQPDLDL